MPRPSVSLARPSALRAPLCLGLLVLLAVSSAGCRRVIEDLRDYSGYAVVKLAAGPNLEQDARTALLTATPGTVIEFPPGVHQMTGTLTVESSHVVIRGAGMYETVLDYSGQQFGTQGILALGDHFAIHDIGIVDPLGDGVKAQGIEGATFFRVRVEWTRGPSVLNGAYGLYPAENSDVLVDGCVVIGARDAGIYIGQSENIVVRYNWVESNVLGIEVENSIDADVSWNMARGNTGGIAVFNLPDLKDGYGTRVYGNIVQDNNTENFAAGGILALVPGGTGIIGIGPKDLEIYDNHIWGNETVNVFISSFDIALEPVTDPDYDKYAEDVHVFNNFFFETDYDPQEFGETIAQFFVGGGYPDVVVGGFADPDKISGFDPNSEPLVAQVEGPNKICVHDNKGVGAPPVGHLNGLVFTTTELDLYDESLFDCSHEARLPVIVPPPTAAPDVDAGLSPAERDALCQNGPAGGVNWDAFVANCTYLDEYGLFQGDDPRVDPTDPGLPYDLTTPLFSDYARKDRFIYVPPGEQIGYSENGVFEFPVGTIIAKTFSFQDTSGAELVDQVIETRLLIHRESGWEGLPYVHTDTGRAVLSVPGAVVPVTVTDPSGITHAFDYPVPDMAQCGSCHFDSTTGGGDVPIGPKARLLNRDNVYPAGPANQLEQMGFRGLLTSTENNPVPLTAGMAPRLPVWDDPGDGSREERARAYLEINCAHCHSEGGRAGFTSLHLWADQSLDKSYGICKRPIAAGAGALGKLWDIDPGHAQDSILVLRMKSTQPAIMMPELARTLQHPEGVSLVSEFVDEDLLFLEGTCE